MDLTYDISKTKTFVFSSKYNYGSKKNRNELNFNSDFIDQKLANKNQLLDQKIVLTNKFLDYFLDLILKYHLMHLDYNLWLLLTMEYFHLYIR